MKNGPEPKIEVATLMAAGVELDGILTLPLEESPYPAIALLHGSDRSGKEDPYYKEHADNLVKSGFAVLRYDGPGWGGRSAQNLNKLYIIKYIASKIAHRLIPYIVGLTLLIASNS